MKEKLSLHRIYLLLRADVMEYKLYILYSLLTAIAIMAVLVAIPQNYTPWHNLMTREAAFYWILSVVCLIYFCNFSGAKIHNTNGLFLTLPTNTLEKFLVLILEGLFIWVTFHLLYGTSIYVGSIVIPDFPVWDFKISSFLHERFPLSLIFFGASLMFLIYSTFRKKALLITILSYAIIIGLNGGSIYLFVKYGNDHGGFFRYAKSYPILNLADMLYPYFEPVMYLSSAILVYISYLKLKEKELR